MLHRALASDKLNLKSRVQTLVQFIFNTGFITAHLAEMNYDANKLPLGKLAKKTILNGFEVLKVRRPYDYQAAILPACLLL